MNAALWSAQVDPSWSFDAWRDLARMAWQSNTPPAAIDWQESGAATLFSHPSIAEAQRVRAAPRAPRDFIELGATVLCHRDPDRFALLYQLLWRMLSGERAVLTNPADPQVIRAFALAQEVRRDAHKMKAFVRFREIGVGRDEYVAWFEPEHRIVDRVAPFFAKRFAGMRWAILTPYRSVKWDGTELSFGDGALAANAPASDAQDELWRAYYANIFNPSRLNLRMMRQEMPVKYWKNLPEARVLPTLVQAAGQRVREMAERAPMPPKRRIPTRPAAENPSEDDLTTLESFNQAARECRACELWQQATQVVTGTGAERARVMLIGEQPGDLEDLKGEPFVGPAGQLLDRALVQAGIDRQQLYLTNAVKHFRFERRGKARLHKTPGQLHVQSCRAWLMKEIELIRPSVIACLGATATAAVLGREFRFADVRGQWLTTDAGMRAFITVHPAWVLRQANDVERARAFDLLVSDLRQLASEAL